MQEAFPRALQAADIVEVVAQAADGGKAPFCICADIAMAYGHAEVRRKNWPKLGCKARLNSNVIWLNYVERLK